MRHSQGGGSSLSPIYLSLLGVCLNTHPRLVQHYTYAYLSTHLQASLGLQCQIGRLCTMLSKCKIKIHCHLYTSLCCRHTLCRNRRDSTVSIGYCMRTLGRLTTSNHRYLTTLAWAPSRLVSQASRNLQPDLRGYVYVWFSCVSISTSVLTAAYIQHQP